MHLIRQMALAIGTAAFLVPVGAQAQNTAGEWPMYRHASYRDGNQSGTGTLYTTGKLAGLSSPTKVGTLRVTWTFPNSALPGPPLTTFVASPIVSNGIAYVGSMNGEMYAIDVTNGKLKWMFPNKRARPTDPNPLLSTCGWGNYGIQASAAYTIIKGEAAIVFGAPDPDPATNNGNGSARLWAVDAKDGHLIWKSDVVARITGCTLGAFPPGNSQAGQPAPEYHEMIRYSSPLPVPPNPASPEEPANGAVYIGIASGENPLQFGSIKWVSLANGKGSSTAFYAENANKPPAAPAPRIGGGVWNGPASDGGSVYFTTGNTRQWDQYCDDSGCAVNPGNIPCFNKNGTPAPGGGPGTTCQTPALHYGLSMVRTDYIGNVKWFFQPLPVNLDQDPDWNAGATVMNTDCGEILASVMKDGWTYALNASTGICQWQFPDMGNPGCKFPANDTHNHGVNGFRVPGAAWGNVLVISTGGYALPSSGPSGPAVSGRLHALDTCKVGSRGTKPGVRWLINPVPNTTSGNDDTVGAPTVINGLIYIPTDQGHVMVYADPSVVKAAGQTCDDTSLSVTQCTAGGGKLVPVPALLKDVALPDHGNAARMRKEVAIAEGFAVVSTSAGHVYGLATQ